jgi:hypothetical protein
MRLLLPLLCSILTLGAAMAQDARRHGPTTPTPTTR